MKDFDTIRNERLSRERTFKLGEETFNYRASVSPEQLLAWDQRHDKQGQDFLDVVDETVIAFLEAGQEAKWAHVRRPGGADNPNPVNIQDIVEVIAWLFEEQVGRPTGQSSASTNGHATTPTPLTAVSSSPAIPAA